MRDILDVGDLHPETHAGGRNASSGRGVNRVQRPPTASDAPIPDNWDQFSGLAHTHGNTHATLATIKKCNMKLIQILNINSFSHVIKSPSRTIKYRNNILR
jgi:hypothetical protein